MGSEIVPHRAPDHTSSLVPVRRGHYTEQSRIKILWELDGRAILRIEQEVNTPKRVFELLKLFKELL